MLTRVDVRKDDGTIALQGARCALGPGDVVHAELKIAGDRLTSIRKTNGSPYAESRVTTAIDLRGHLVMPGLINAHDHLQFALFPRLGHPPYRNYVEWGDDIHATLAATIAEHKFVAKRVRLWWGGIRNLLCGVTTVCHHDPLWPELLRESFPVRVLDRRGWAHSVALGGDLHQARASAPDDAPFLIHACEGVDDMTREEIFALHRAGLLGEATVLIHGLGLDEAGVTLMNEKKASLILCPSSNQFLFQRLPEMKVLSKIERLALGNDSPLTATGDLLDEVRFAIERCNIAPELAYSMVTTEAAAILHLHEAAALHLSASADLVVVRDTGEGPAERMRNLSFREIELVMLKGRVQLASATIWQQLPPSVQKGMEPLWIEGVTRWLRAPVASLVRDAEAVLGVGCVKLGGHSIRVPKVSDFESVMYDRYPVMQGVRI